jgi:hypothetical protein
MEEKTNAEERAKDIEKTKRFERAAYIEKII